MEAQAGRVSVVGYFRFHRVEDPIPEGWSDNGPAPGHHAIRARVIKQDGVMIDWTFIGQLEGFRTRGYVPDQGSSQSGVTIGMGVDLGHWTADQLRRRRVPDAVIRKVSPYLGLRGDDAIEVAGELMLHELDAEILSSCIQGDIVDALKSRYGRAQKAGTLKWDYLPSAPATVVTSVAFQYGPALSVRTPKFWRAVVHNDWTAMLAELRNFGDRYKTRRNREADHLERVISV